MTINKKMIRNAVIGILAIAVLSGAYYWAVKWEPGKTDAGDEGSAFESISLFKTEEENISEIFIKNTEAVFTLKRSGEGDDAVWSIPEYSDIEFSQSKIKNAVFGFMSFYADKEITDDSGKLEEFGLADEKNSVTIRLKDGSETTLVLGDKLVVDDKYYIKKKGEDRVYTISGYKAAEMLKCPSDFRETNLGSIDNSGIQEMSVSHGNEKIIEIYNSGEDQGEDVFHTSSIRMRYPYDEIISNDRYGELVQTIPTSVEVISFVSDDVNNAAQYGLDNGYRVTIRDTEKEHRFIFGNADDSGNIYAMYNDNRFIFTMIPDILNAVKDIKPFDYVEKFAHIYGIDKVSSIAVEYGENEHTLTIKKTGSGDDEKFEYAVDGKTAKEDAFKDMYQAIIGLTVTDIAGSGTQGSKVCEVRFKMNDGRERVAAYYEYDERNVLVVRPDGRRYLMLKKYVESMTEKLDRFAESPTEELD